VVIFFVIEKQEAIAVVLHGGPAMVEERVPKAMLVSVGVTPRLAWT
jgi:hypothetical protein